MGDPTIEQNSHFTAKTKEGQDVEFRATLKFYVNPSGDVKINAPGGGRSPSGDGQPGRGGDEPSAGRGRLKQKADIITDDEDEEEDEDEADEDESEKEDEPEEEDKPQKEDDKQPPKDEKPKPITREDDHFPRHTESDCPITQFIPDPCRAIDDLQKSIKSIMSSFFGGSRKCVSSHEERTPPKSKHRHSTTNIIAQDSDNKENKEESEVIQNEEKYDV